jgi:hypothetical protein
MYRKSSKRKRGLYGLYENYCIQEDFFSFRVHKPIIQSISCIKEVAFPVGNMAKSTATNLDYQENEKLAYEGPNQDLSYGGAKIRMMDRTYFIWVCKPSF